LPATWWIIYLRDLARFVVPADERDTVRISHFQRKKKQKCLDGIEATIDEVAHEEIIRIRNVSTNLEKLLQVVELAMDVSTNL